MRIASMIALAFVASVPNLAQAGTTQNSSVAPQPPGVAAQADRLLKEMGDYLGSAQAFTFHADITFDHVLPSGQKLQYSATEDVALRRPNGLYVEWSGDLGDRQFWFDGKSVTLFDPATPFYAAEAAPTDIDAMLNAVVEQLGFSPPLADFLYRDPYWTVRGNVQFGLDLGVNQVNGRSCRTLAFVEENIDWQIWMDTGPQLIPCKLVITYKTRPAQPQFSAVFSDWDFAPRIAEAVFTPELPPGARKIPFAPIVASASHK